MIHIGLIVSALLLGLVVAYAMWVRVRPWVLRQDLFEIRDDLWRDMRDAGTLNNPVHRHVRESINILIRLAPQMSLPMWLTMREAGRDVKHHQVDWDSCPRAARAFDEARERLAVYIVNQSIYGRFQLARANRFFRNQQARKEECAKDDPISVDEFRGINWAAVENGKLVGIH